MKKLLLGLSVASLFALGGCSSVKRAYDKAKEKVTELVSKKKGAETQKPAEEAGKQAEAKKK